MSSIDGAQRLRNEDIESIDKETTVAYRKACCAPTWGAAVLCVALQLLITDAAAQTFEELKALQETIVREIDQLNHDNQKRVNEYEAAATLEQRSKILAENLKQLRGLVERQQAATRELQARVQEAAGRHAQWVAQLRAQVDASMPDWKAIVDIAT